MRTDHARLARAALLAASVVASAGCSGVVDDLLPSGTDERPAVVAGSVGPAVGQTAPDFTLPDSLGKPVSLYGALGTSRAVVLYFTMWCNICFDHMAAMRADVMSQNPDVAFFAVDYVSGTVEGTRASELMYADLVAGFHVLADTADEWERYYRAPMGTVIVDRNRVVRWNAEYSAAKVPPLLAGLP
jgi:thiol-disulfide isomerase/thioredoxin